LQLGATLKAVICQRLVPTADGRGRIAALEIMRVTPRVRELVEDKDRTKELYEAIAEGHITYGMQTFDQSLMALLGAGFISYEEALRQATNPSNFALRVQGISSTSDSKWDNFERGSVPTGPAAQAPAPRSSSVSTGKSDLDRY
jgi:twitching motility protein PilT